MYVVIDVRSKRLHQHSLNRNISHTPCVTPGSNVKARKEYFLADPQRDEATAILCAPIILVRCTADNRIFTASLCQALGKGEVEGYSPCDKAGQVCAGTREINPSILTKVSILIMNIGAQSPAQNAQP